MLADTAPAAQSLYDFFLVLALFASIGGNLALIYATRAKAKREVTFGFIPAAKEEFDKHVAHDAKEHDQLWAKIGGLDRNATAKLDAITKEWRGFVDTKLGELSAESNEGGQRLWDKLSRVGEDVARLSGDTQQLNKRIDQLDGKIDRLRNP